MDSSRKKRLGQYFSGQKVAELLVSMVALHHEDHVIDPMAGIGDMLVATMDAGVAKSNISGIEIDHLAGKTCNDRIGLGTVIVADAFKLETYNILKRTSWDAVITNPPYVRYQSLNGFDNQALTLQNAKETRNSLLSIIREVKHLSKEERNCLLRITRSYSGLSDLAVPAWILCASIVAPGGTLAIVVPESWLNREYALSIKYLLLKFFDIQYVVEDLNSAWFPDALVKTNLIVAKRVAFRKEFAIEPQGKYKHIRIASSLIGENSLVDNMQYLGYTGKKAFLTLLNAENDVRENGFTLKIVPTCSMVSEMVNTPAFNKLYTKLEHTKIPNASRSFPDELCTILNAHDTICPISNLQSWGFMVGQGLRTGANRFFYAESEGIEGNDEKLLVDKLFKKRHILVSKVRTKPVLRYQSDIKDSLVINSADLVTRLLYIQNDLSDTEPDLSRHIEEAENIDIVNADKTTHFQDLSAVKPNIRNVVVNGHIVNRKWYMLPVLMPRHMPALCIPRINYKEAKCILIADEDIVVDANFSTLWMSTKSQDTIYAMFAMFNSSWMRAYLETISTVMGGGALKTEASHIRQVLFPEPTVDRICCLSNMGKRLAIADISMFNEIRREIDVYLLTQLFGVDKAQEQVERLNAYLKYKITNRRR